MACIAFELPRSSVEASIKVGFSFCKNYELLDGMKKHSGCICLFLFSSKKI